MSDRRLVLAPGKLVLLGEYAVLDGAPALALAIDRGVACLVEPVGPGEPLRLETPGDDRFARAALDAVNAPAARYRFFAHRPVDLPSKPGFGSSAAATVAAVLAGGGRGPEAFDVHHAVQGGGSGVDVAASLVGGLILFRSGVTEALEPVRPLVVYAGRAASTGPRVEAYLAWSGDRSSFLEHSRALVDLFIEQPVAALEQARLLLTSMAQQAGIDYLTPTLRRIARIAADCGGASKPSGAGGGDCAVALFHNEQDAAAFTHRCQRAGFPIISVQPAPAAAVVGPQGVLP